MTNLEQALQVLPFFSQKHSDCLKDVWKFWITNLGIDSWIWRARTFFPFGRKIWKHFMQFKVPTLNILCTAGMQRRGHLGLEGDHRAVQWIRSLSPIILLCISKWVEILYEGDFVTKVIIYDQLWGFWAQANKKSIGIYKMV